MDTKQKLEQLESFIVEENCKVKNVNAAMEVAVQQMDKIV